MSDYNPPVENVPIFDSSLFSSTNKTEKYLTRENADSLYLHYPIAQGTESFPENIILSGTTNTNYIQFPDGSKQYTASVAQQFQPIFVNYSGYQATGTGYSQGPIVTFNGTWGINDWAMLRVCQQGSYDDEGGEWKSYASTSGTLICRPYYMPSGTWAGIDSLVYYTSNSTNYSGPTKKALYYSTNINQGTTQNYFSIYGSYKSIQFFFRNRDSSVNGWSTTIELEYVCRSVNGGSVSFSNGSGTNNSLP